MNHAAFPQKPCDVLVSRASLRGLTPEIQDSTNGTVEHPMVV
jgi:hypothetical protein